MAITNFSVNKLRFWAVVLGIEIELTRVELNYALNSIPTAELNCAIGRDVKTLEAAAIHFVVQFLAVNVPVTVYCEAFEVADSGESGGLFPPGPFIVFDGRVVGIGYQKSRAGGATLRLFCRHFLMDLEYALNSNLETHPRNIGDGAMNAGIEVVPGNPNFVVQSTASGLFTADNIEEDYWGSALQPWLAAVMDLEQVFQGDVVGEGQGQDDALDALDRIEPGSEGYEFSVPLQLDAFDVLEFPPAIQAIANDAARNTFESFTGTTIWEKIVQEFGSKMTYALVPMANRALIVPFIPGLRNTWLTINPDEYDAISLETDLPRALRGVAIYTGMNSQCGAFGFMQGQAGAMRTIGGLYENKDIDPGMYIFRNGPMWLTNSVSAAFWARNAMPVNRVIGNAINPGIGNGPRDGINPVDVRFAAESMWDAYAHAIYLYEALKMRRGTLGGRMRFDIAPGSTIAVVTSEEKFVAQQSPVADDLLYGLVTRVTVLYDSDAVHGQTNIEFGWLRNFTENESDLAVDFHPLYATTFSGAPLCEEQPIGSGVVVEADDDLEA